ncbi:chaperone modulator CbpM [Paucibacter sp. B2R-40]|uniref:chaperone modulator CbpM n=1 Tax=Paucibacter sp. B2R-40 TaxID=2893554 RepID=UPI0021E42C60|nr:chaperone modulator CbpM [Paucibacter sp. B2R-40]MCV2356462.1 chaperone modulator CbpM [Paucibacter sp. B2R-40]
MAMNLVQQQGAEPAIVVEREWQFTLSGLSQACQVDALQVAELVHEGVFGVMGEDMGQWLFEGAALRRARLALRLQRELDLAPHGTALVLDLLEEIDQLKRRLSRAGC